MCPAVPMVAELACSSVVCALVTLKHRILVHSLLHKEDRYEGDWWAGATYSVDTLGKGQVRSQVGGRKMARDAILQLGLIHTLNLSSVCF